MEGSQVSSGAPSKSSDEPVKIFLCTPNPAKNNNLGPVLRCTAGFGAELVVVGVKKFSTHGAHGSNKHVKVRHFYEWFELRSFLKREMNCWVYGMLLKQKQRSLAVSSRAFVQNQNIALIIPHRHEELSEEQMSLCDDFIHIDPCFSPGLNLELPIRLGITLHHLTAHANFSERSFQGEKYVVDHGNLAAACPQDDGSASNLNALAIRAERKARREQQTAEDPLSVAEQQRKGQETQEQEVNAENEGFCSFMTLMEDDGGSDN